MPILSVKNLSVQLDDRLVLDDVSFELARGESLAIIGPNGSGKTVLLRALMGRLPYRGEVVWASGTRIGYVPQKIDADRHLPLTLENLLAAKAKILRIPPQEIAAIARTVALTEEILHTPLGHLSGGQFQKALIAFALLGKPTIVIFDEPTASLDQPQEEQTYELVHRLQDECQLTVIIVSHELSLVYRYATKVLCLNQKNICFGEPEEVLTKETLEKLYGIPLKYYHHLHKEEYMHEMKNHGK